MRFHVLDDLNFPKTRHAGSRGVLLELELYVNEVASNLFAMEQQDFTDGVVAANAIICPVRPTPGNSYFKGQVIIDISSCFAFQPTHSLILSTSNFLAIPRSGGSTAVVNIKST